MTQTVTRGESLGAQVARVLRQRIVRGELAPGARLPEEALADHPRLEGAWNQYLPTFTALLEVTINHDEDLHESADDHVKLLDVMRTGSPDAAAAVLSAHLDGARERMLHEVGSR